MDLSADTVNEYGRNCICIATFRKAYYGPRGENSQMFHEIICQLTR